MTIDFECSSRLLGVCADDVYELGGIYFAVTYNKDVLC